MVTVHYCYFCTFSLVEKKIQTSTTVGIRIMESSAAGSPDCAPESPASAGGICAGAFYKKTAWQIGGVRASAEWI